MLKDSMNQPLQVGDLVKFRGGDYIIKDFYPGEGRFGTARLEFEEPVPPEILRTWGQPDEAAVDLLKLKAVEGDCGNDLQARG